MKKTFFETRTLFKKQKPIQTSLTWTWTIDYLAH